MESFAPSILHETRGCRVAGAAMFRCLLLHDEVTRATTQKNSGNPTVFTIRITTIGIFCIFLFANQTVHENEDKGNTKAVKTNLVFNGFIPNDHNKETHGPH